MSEDQRPPDEPEPTRLDSEDLPGGSDDTTHAGGEKPEDGSTAKRLGDFELLRELGRGGMGIVYEARQISLKRRVALKVLPPALGMTAQAKQRFEREAQAAAKLHHTSIVPVYAIGEHDGHHFYAMELIDGQSLDHVLREMVAGHSAGVTRNSGAAQVRCCSGLPTLGITASLRSKTSRDSPP